MAGSLTLDSWPGTSGITGAAYFNRFLEEMQTGMPGDPPGVLPYNTQQILGAYSNEFKVFADSTGMQVKVYQGRVYCKGIFAKIADADAGSGSYTLDVTAAHATLYRIDRVVVEVTFATGACVLKMLNGTAATQAAAVPAALTQNATKWEIPLAYVFVDAAVVTIAAKDVADCRMFCPTANELARVLAIDEAIVNGGMLVWNDGTTFTSIADGTTGPECWVYQKSGAVVHDLLRSTDVPAVADANAQYTPYSLHLDVTTSDASIAAGDLAIISNRIEGFLAQPYVQRGFTLPFWVKAAKTGVHCVAFRNSGADRSYVAEFVVSAADTWELHYVHVPPSPSAGTWDYGNGLGLAVTWTLVAGSTFETTPGAWQTGNFLTSARARAFNEVDSTANNFKIALVGRMAPGNLVLPYSPRAYPTELALTHRYCRKWGPGAVNTIYASGYSNGTGSALYGLPLSPPMRGAPSAISLSAVGDFSGIDGASATLNALVIGAASPDAVQLSVTQAGTTWTTGRGNVLLGNGSATMALKARL